MAREQEIPFVFALGRKALGRCVNKLVPVSVVGIFNYSGAEVSTSIHINCWSKQLCFLYLRTDLAWRAHLTNMHLIMALTYIRVCFYLKYSIYRTERLLKHFGHNISVAFK